MIVVVGIGYVPVNRWSSNFNYRTLNREREKETNTDKEWDRERDHTNSHGEDLKESRYIAKIQFAGPASSKWGQDYEQLNIILYLGNYTPH